MRYLLFTLFLLLFSSISAQTLQGIVYNTEGEPLPNCLIIVKKSSPNSGVLSYTRTDNHGEFMLDISDVVLSNGLQEILLEVSKIDYTAQNQVIDINGIDLLDLRYTLERTIIDLESIVIKAKPKPINNRNDTIIYHPDSFKDGSEKTVEDLLRNLPGMEVDDAGKIRFKGNLIDRVLLEEDDLFNSNYTVGTKNIDVDILEEVQVLEKWNENPLLKGIEDTDKIAINLKLKKGKLSFSGSADVGYGIEDRYNADIHTLAINKKHKNYTFLSYNNTGDNNSSYDYLTHIPSLDDVKNKNFKVSKLIDEQMFASDFQKQRIRLNDNWYGSTNQIYKISKNLSTKLNFDYYKDKLNIYKSSSSQYAFGNHGFSTFETDYSTKKPLLYSADLEIKFKSSKNSLTVFKSKWGDENVETLSDFNINNQEDLYGNLSSKNYFNKQTLEFTQKLKNQKALEFSTVYSSDLVSQNYTITPALDFINNIILENDKTIQDIESKRNTVQLQGGLLGKFSSKQSYKIGLGLTNTNDYVNSILSSTPSISNYFSKNKFQLKTLKITFGGQYSLQWKRVRLKTWLNVSHFNMNFFDYLNNDDKPKTQWVLFPKINLTYALSPNANFIFSQEYNQSPQRIDALYNDFILTSFRRIHKNENNLVFQNKYSAFAAYSINDIYNQFGLLLGLNYNNTKNSLFNQNLVTLVLNQTKTITLPENNETYGMNFNIQKYIPYVSSTIKFKSNYTISQYKNMINSSDLRDNRSHVFNSELFYKTSFNMPINFQNIFYYNYLSNRAEGHKEFSIASLRNDFKIFFKPKRTWFSSLVLEYYNPNLDYHNSYYFLDFELNYKPKNAAWDIALEGKNLTGNKTYDIYTINDFSETVSQQVLNNPYVMMTFSFKF
ncbi:hypothetical protein GO491_10620 [Flavobacteriaceae bacterium Ap0902]|nr:hypothetical protein [Flavobacteriaceae bacterium Ap0902]